MLLTKLARIPQKVRNAYYPKKHLPLFVPEELVEPRNKIDVTSAWRGLELVIPDILKQYNVASDSCIEFGVEFGYSTVVFSNYFKKVIGIDLFEGDINTQHRGDHFPETQRRLSPYPNIELHKISYQDWIATDSQHYDFAHVDIVHTYRDTFRCGLWAAQHSKCAVFHDTESYIDVRNAVIDIARETGKAAFNYPHHFGLGIIVG